MTDPNLRCQVANAMVDELPPIPDGTCISNIATNMADVMLSTAAELVPRSKHPRGAQGWCAGPGVETDMNAAWQQREEERRHLRAESHSSNLRKAAKMAETNLRKVRKSAVLSFFWGFVRKLETRTQEGDQAGFYKNLKTMNLKGKRDRSSACVKYENDGSGGSTLASTPSHRGLTRKSQKTLASGPKTYRQEFSSRCRS